MLILSAENQRLFDNVLSSLLREAGLCRLREYVQHGDTDCFWHSLAVAYYSLNAAQALRLPVDKRSLLRGALLHDYFLYDWHIPDPSHRLHGFTHPRTALYQASQRLRLNPVEQNIILRHMFPLTPFPPKYWESLLVCLTDKACSLNETLFRRRYRKLRERYRKF